MTGYAEAVISGLAPACRWVRLACERHRRDLAEGVGRGLVWDLDAANHAIGFFADVLVLAEGEYAGQPFLLQPWQQFIVGSLFGWKKQRGERLARRFRTAYCEVGKGNGKTPIAAGIALFGLVADGEPAAEIYSAATTHDQASICFRDAKRMVESSPALQEAVETKVGYLQYRKSILRAVSSDHKSLDGKRVHLAVIDELHEHPSSLVVDKMRAGTKGRSQALIVEITNAGFDRESVCWQHHEYSRRVLDSVDVNDEWFAFVCGLDEGDDWRDPAVWPKANPNLGISIRREYLEEQVREAEGMPGKQNLVRRLNFCEWTESHARWLDLERWDASAGVLSDETLRGKPCHAGLDLASTTDLAAFVLLFKVDDGYQVLPFFWAPDEGAIERERRDRVPYLQWAKAGLIELTEGNVTDYDVIRHRIGELGKIYQIKEIAVDRWNATQVMTQLAGDGFEMIQFGQGFASMTAPTKELEKLVLSGKIAHGGNPVLRWMASNVMAETDAAGNLKPSKKRSTEKIDGIVALIMALGRAMVVPEKKPSVYSQPGRMMI